MLVDEVSAPFFLGNCHHLPRNNYFPPLEPPPPSYFPVGFLPNRTTEFNHNGPEDSVLFDVQRGPNPPQDRCLSNSMDPWDEDPYLYLHENHRNQPFM